MKRPSLLVVDDAINLTLFYQQELEDDGYRVDIANSTRTAAKLLETTSYDLIIMEPMMMEFEEIREFQQNMNHGRRTPVIVNTVNPEFECLRIFWGMEVCVIKSSDISSLKEQIEVLLQPGENAKMSGGLDVKEHEHAEHCSQWIAAY